MQDETLDDLIDKVSGLSINSHVPISASLIENKSTKTAKLVNNTEDSNKLKSRNTWLSIKFKAPLLIFQVEVQGENFSSTGPFELEWDSATKKANTPHSQKPDGDTATFSVNDFVTELRLKPPRKYFGEAYLQSIQLRGLPIRRLEANLSNLASLLELQDRIRNTAQATKQELADRQSRVETLEQKVPSLNETISELEQEIEDKTQTNEGLQQELSSARSTLEQVKQSADAASQRQASSETQIEESRNTLKHIKAEISDARAELKDLKDDINLFPTEFREYVNEGASTVKKYAWLIILPSLILLLMMLDLFFNASQFVDKASDAEKPVWELLLLRLPYVFISFAIITACWQIAARFANEMIKVFRQRLDLSKVSIIAKDISDAVASTCEISAEQQADKYMWLKMNALRASFLSTWDETPPATTPSDATEHAEANEHMNNG